MDPDGECLTSEVTPELLVNLGIELPDDQGETPPPDVPAGETFTIQVVIGNLEPEGVAGLIAQAINMHGTIDTPGCHVYRQLGRHLHDQSGCSNHRL